MNRIIPLKAFEIHRASGQGRPSHRPTEDVFTIRKQRMVSRPKRITPRPQDICPHQKSAIGVSITDSTINAINVEITPRSNMNRNRAGGQVFRYHHRLRRSASASSRPLPDECVLFSRKQNSTTCIACQEIDRR